MLRRPLVSLFTVLSAAGSLAAQNPPAAPPAGGQAPAGAGRQQGPRAYRDVITAAAQTDSGMFIVHRIADRLYYEIPRGMLNKDMLLVADQRGTIRGVRYAGEEISNRIVRWERMGNRIFFRIVSYAMRADTASPVARAVALSNVAPIVMSFDVEAWSPDDSNAVIEATRLFTTDVQELNLRQANIRVRRFDPARSFVERARSFPRNLEVSALHTFEVDSVPGPPGQGGFNRSLNTLTMLMNYSMVLLPERPMMARLCDDRVGYFSFSFENFDEDRVPGGIL